MSNLDLLSPNSVIANAIHDVPDIFPHVPSDVDAITVHVGTQINGQPHLGTLLTHAAAFVVADAFGRYYEAPSRVEFVALDNAPVMQANGANGELYQRLMTQSPADIVAQEEIERNYCDFYLGLIEASGVPAQITTYFDMQSQPEFRDKIHDIILEQERIGRQLNPRTGQLKIRVPAEDGFAEKSAKHVQIAGDNFQGIDIDGKPYEVELSTAPFVDANTLLRNLVKESILADRTKKSPKDTHIIVKGADWSLGTPLVDRAAGVLGYTANELPSRIFTPLILDNTGSKLSKSAMNQTPLGLEIRPNAATAKIMHKTMAELVKKPRDFFRNYTVDQMTAILREMGNAASN